MSIENNLRSISELYKTDKLEHGYIEIYNSYFKDLKNKELKANRGINCNKTDEIFF